MLSLKLFDEIKESRIKLEKDGASCLTRSGILRWLRDHNMAPGVNVGHFLKSWDIELIYKYINHNYDYNSLICDFGCFGSEILPILSQKGYQNLYGVDTDSGIYKMPYQNKIKYICDDYHRATLIPSNSLDAVISVSAIEHGYDPRAILKSVTRKLKKDGVFIFSFDYWPNKINTDGIMMFGRTWDILSDKDLSHLKDVASEYGFKEIDLNDYQNTNSINLEKEPIHWANKDYTFGLIVLKKVKDVDI